LGLIDLTASVIQATENLNRSSSKKENHDWPTNDSSCGMQKIS